MPPAMSIHSITLPPKAALSGLASGGKIICVITTSESRGDFGGAGALTCMHMHLSFLVMRTTVELRADTIHELKARAAKLGKRGFSDLIQEAADRFLEETMDPDEQARFDRIMKLSG